MKYCLFLILILLFSCDDFTSSEDINKHNIEDILDHIQTSFYTDDVTSIMENYHPDFRHNTNSFSDEETLWQIRVVDFYDIAIEDVTIDLNNSIWATASFKLTLFYDEDKIVTMEPSEANGDLSYFYKDDGQWKICGKDFISPR